MTPLDEPPPRPLRPAFLPGREVMSVMDAIYAYRAVRDFKPDLIPEASMHALLYAAVQAPTVTAGEVWGFAVIQDKSVLKALSDSAGRLLDSGAKQPAAAMARPEGYFNIFFNAGSLIVIYGRMNQPYAEADCWLAAQNLMLAANGMGLGSCIIGLAIEALNTPEWKATLDIPGGMTAVAPIVLGVPAQVADAAQSPAPDVLSWMRD